MIRKITIITRAVAKELKNNGFAVGYDIDRDAEIIHLPEKRLILRIDGTNVTARYSTPTANNNSKFIHHSYFTADLNDPTSLDFIIDRVRSFTHPVYSSPKSEVS